jgi:hypothetical protein
MHGSGQCYQGNEARVVIFDSMSGVFTDSFHEAVKHALSRDGWLNIAPISLRYGTTKLEVDLSAERFLRLKRDRFRLRLK